LHDTVLHDDVLVLFETNKFQDAISVLHFFDLFPLACNVLYINSVDMESLTGPQAVAKAITETFAAKSAPMATIVHFKVSTQGITLTDNQRK